MTGFALKSFSLLNIENSAEIQSWLNQFEEKDKAAARIFSCD